MNKVTGLILILVVVCAWADQLNGPANNTEASTNTTTTTVPTVNATTVESIKVGEGLLSSDNATTTTTNTTDKPDDEVNPEKRATIIIVASGNGNSSETYNTTTDSPNEMNGSSTVLPPYPKYDFAGLANQDSNATKPPVIRVMHYVMFVVGTNQTRNGSANSTSSRMIVDNNRPDKPNSNFFDLLKLIIFGNNTNVETVTNKPASISKLGSTETNKTTVTTEATVTTQTTETTEAIQNDKIDENQNEKLNKTI